jgi:hypothetical protein
MSTGTITAIAVGVVAVLLLDPDASDSGQDEALAINERTH